MAFFNEFPHTRTYDSDLAWLIRRMKEVLSRMDSLEERMKALEDLVTDFINTANIPQLIKDELQRMIDDGELSPIVKNIVLNSLYSYRYIDVPVNEIYSSKNTLPLANTNNTIRLSMFSGQLYLGNGYMTFNTVETRNAFPIKNNTETIYRTNPDASGTSGLTIFLDRNKINEYIAPWGVRLTTVEETSYYSSAPQAQVRTRGSSPLMTANVHYSKDEIRIDDFLAVTGGSVTLVGANTTGYIHLMPMLLPITAL